MREKFYILIGLVVLSLYACKQNEKQDSFEQPNIIFVITDDQGYGDMGHTGNTIIQTPALDQFSQESVNLTNYHVGTTCAPTRAGLLTGRNCNRNGVWHTIMGASMLNGDETTLAEVLQQNDYATGMFGKWHLGDNHPFLPHTRGFDEAFYHGGGGVGQTPDYWTNDYFDDTYFRNGEPEKQTGYCTDVWFDEAMKFINKKNKKPFFCYLSLNAPHSPYNVPETYYNKYKDVQNITEDQKRFYGMISNIDDNFGRLLKQVKALGIEDNTIVIFTTDNGTSRGIMTDSNSGKKVGYNANMRGVKGSEYDGGHRVPFIIRWPDGRLSGGQYRNQLIAHVDIFSTLTQFAGIKYESKKTLDGTDVSPYLVKEDKKIPKRMLVTDTQRVPWPIKGKNSCVMDGNWRLINGTELYDVSKDVSQENNIAEQYPERVKEMNEFYEEWWKDVIKETKYSVIELGKGTKDVLTCHDARTIDFYPPWNQQLIREGKAMEPAPFRVNFKRAGTYKFSLTRWPKESGLGLGDESLDQYKARAYMDANIKGEAMKFSKAYLKIGDKQIESSVDNTQNAATLEMQVEQGETDLTAYFDLENGGTSNAFYVYVQKVD